MRKIIYIIICCMLTTSCGYKVSKFNKNFQILDIQTSGDKRVNYLIKNRLLLSSKKESGNLITIDILTDKIKSINEKNINNQITKYQIKIVTQLKYKNSIGNLSEKVTITKVGSYNVGSKHSNTLNNEKNLTNLLAEKIVEEVLTNISSSLNDL